MENLVDGWAPDLTVDIHSNVGADLELDLTLVIGESDVADATSTREAQIPGMAGGR
jgi:hypothetical protein